MPSQRDRAWEFFDAIVATAAMRDVNPWQVGEQRCFEPDYDTLGLLLAVPATLRAASQSGIPALALDVWVAYEFRRAGFDRDRVWPREVFPRVLPSEILEFIARLPKAEQARLRERIAVRGTGGVSTANVLGKNYVKQVDVVMSSWATGPELMVSTKRMDSSFGKNAANRVEESYGDAKNLRLRHPQAALGFVYALSSVALTEEPETAEWLIDLLGKLGREDDAYHAVALVLPDLDPDSEPPGEPESDDAGPLHAGAADDLMLMQADSEGASSVESSFGQELLAAELHALRPIALRRDVVPPELDPGRFFHVMCDRLLDSTPVNFHVEARRRRSEAAMASGH